jgi:hypothetical protein
MERGHWDDGPTHPAEHSMRLVLADEAADDLMDLDLKD